MTDYERLSEIVRSIKFQYKLTQREVAMKIGLKSATYLSDVLNGRHPVSEQISDSLMEAFPEYSKDWLLTGEGSMIVGEDDPADVPTPAPDPAKAIRYYPNIPATASHVENMPEPSWDDLRYEPMWITGWEGCSALNATGDSMYPRISNGDVVIFRRWTESYVSNGEIYLVITRDGDRMIKYVTEIEPDEEGGRRFRCASANPDQERFAPFVVAGEDIVSLYVVCGCIKRFRS